MSLLALVTTFVHVRSTARIDSGICHPHVIYMDNCSCSFKYKAFYVHPSCHEFHILWCQLCHVTFCPKGLVTLGHKYCLSTIGSPNFKTYPFLLFKKMFFFQWIFTPEATHCLHFACCSYLILLQHSDFYQVSSCRKHTNP